VIHLKLVVQPFLFFSAWNCVSTASLDAYEWIICHLLESTCKKLKDLASNGVDSFTAKNDSQAYYYRPLSIAYAEVSPHVIPFIPVGIHQLLIDFQAATLRRMIHLVDDPNIAPQLRIVLKRLAALFGAFHLEKHASVLSRGYFQPACTLTLQCAVEQLCTQLKPDAVALVDAIAPTDFILNSALGRSDGQIYEELQKKFQSSMAQRPSWWKFILEKPILSHL